MEKNEKQKCDDGFKTTTECFCTVPLVSLLALLIISLCAFCFSLPPQTNPMLPMKSTQNHHRFSLPSIDSSSSSLQSIPSIVSSPPAPPHLPAATHRHHLHRSVDGRHFHSFSPPVFFFFFLASFCLFVFVFFASGGIDGLQNSSFWPPFGAKKGKVASTIFDVADFLHFFFLPSIFGRNYFQKREMDISSKTAKMSSTHSTTALSESLY